MNLFSDIRALVLEALTHLQQNNDLPREISFDAITVEPPRDASHGDMATNAAMVLAKPAAQSPRALAEKLIALMTKDERIKDVQVAGPGFINITLNAGVWAQAIHALLQNPAAFGTSSMGDGKRVNVEFVSANPTGPLHVGHTRGAVFGDALSNLLSFSGYKVTREYYINDGGAQVDVLARSVYLRYLEAHGKQITFEEGVYPGDYLIEVGQALKDKVGARFCEAPEREWLEEVREFSMKEMMDLIKSNLAALGVTMDVYFSEKSLYGNGIIEQAIERLNDKGLIFEGTLEAPIGKQNATWTPRQQTLFKSTAMGDDRDRPVKKADGSWTYFAPDIAYHYDKLQRGFNVIINVFGADHGGYVKRMKAAVAALSDTPVLFDIKITQLVNLYKNGKPFKMSKRAGTFITLQDVIDQVGTDVTRFVMLTRKNDAVIDFDFEKVLEESKDNPVFYVQYAHARICSVIQKAKEAGIDVSDSALHMSDVEANQDTAELALAAKIAEFPRLIETAARTHEPHRVAFYLYELAGMFQSLYNKGNAEPDLRFLQVDNPAITQSKIALIRSVAVVISQGLSILGIKPVQKM